MGEKQRQRERERETEKTLSKRKRKKDREQFHVPNFLSGVQYMYINMSTIVNYNLIKTMTQRLARIAIFRGAFFGVDHQAALEFELHPDAAPDESSCGGRWN